MKWQNRKIENNQVIISILIGFLVYCCVGVKADNNTLAPTLGNVAQKSIEIIQHNSCNLHIQDIIDPNHIIVKLNNPCHNYFCTNLINVPTNKTITMGLSMDLQSNKENKADVTKWDGLVPQFTYGDINDPATFEWYRKDANGYWISGNPLDTGNAGKGLVPEQKVIPAAEAPDCLKDSGKYWDPWIDIKDTEQNNNLNIYRVKIKAKLPSITVAMRIPCINAVIDDFINQLRKVKPLCCNVYTIGRSIKGRDLYVVFCHDSMEIHHQKLMEKPTVVFYASDGNEHDANWICYGILRFLVSSDKAAKEILKKINIIILPMFDPDGVAGSTWAHLTKTFELHNFKDTIPMETLSYARFFDSWIEKGDRLDIVCELHNVECSETSSNILCPIIDLRHYEAIVNMNNYILDHITNYKTSKDIWMSGYMDSRLCGWCAKHFGSIDCTYEINGRSSSNKLELDQLQRLGNSLTIAFAEYMETANFFKQITDQVDFVRNYHISQQKAYWATQNKAQVEHSPYQSITLGF